MEGRVDIGDLRIVQNSGSVIQITGKSGSADLDLSSGATFKSPDFSTRACTAEASSGQGSGSVSRTNWRQKLPVGAVSITMEPG